MAALDNFIGIADQLVEFETYFNELNISDLTETNLEIEKNEFLDIWTKFKASYKKCLQYCSFTKSKKKETTAKEKAGDASEEDSEELVDAAVVKSKYRDSHRLFVRCLSKITDQIAQIAQKTASKVSDAGSKRESNLVSNVHLPPCDIDPFEGDYLSWPTFRDLFTALYINNARLSQVEKLYHLLQKTRGEAKDIVQKVPLTNEGFNLAWENLKTQYENPRILINNQLKVLFNLKRIANESGSSIKTLQRDINNSISVLQLHQIDISNWDAIIVYLCSTRLPEATLSLWEQSISNKPCIPKWKDMDQFLTDRYHTLETVLDIRTPVIDSKSPISKPTHPSQSYSNNKAKPVKSFHTNVSNNSPCKLCKGSHPLRLCSRFLQMGINDRFSTIKKLNCCINCLAFVHQLRDCQSSHNCFVCKKRHNTLLHREISVTSNPSNYQNQSQASSNRNFHSNNRANKSSLTQNRLTATAENNHVAQNQIQSTLPSTSGNASSAFPTATNLQNFFVSTPKNVLLGTAIINVIHLEVVYTIRALIDPASEGTFMSERLRNRLKIPFKSIDAQVSGLNGTVSARTSKLCNLIIGSALDPSMQLSINALILPNLTGNLPSFNLNPHKICELPDIHLADPNFYQSSQVDLLIGGDLYPTILRDGILRNVLGSLIAQETIFGWILTGPITNLNNPKNFVSFYTEVTLDKQIAKFWEIEEIPTTKPSSPADQYCEELFCRTTYRDKDGRYVVDLPFNHESSNKLQVGFSRNIAMSQFQRNERSLCRIPELKTEYDRVIKEYLNLNHMEEINPNCSRATSNFYLPHHAIIKPDRKTTKVRVVFNASSKSSNGLSLNDILHTGPALQKDLTTLILKWRFFRYVFNADIEKMYRQIKVNSLHTPFQRIVFRDSPESTIRDYELKTVTFGVNCAPYLAIRTLLQLSEDVKDSYPLASTILQNHMYVDDVLSGAHDLEIAQESRRQFSEALESAGFSLRKWTSNHKAILQNVPSDHLLDVDFLEFDDKSTAKMLGVFWNAKADLFYFVTQPLEIKTSYTKREVLSIIAKLFDPAGWLAPVVIVAKIIMQQIWLEKSDWDEPLKPLTLHNWQNFVTGYHSINLIKVPRWINFETHSTVEIHAFCDASEKAYAATIYIRIENPNKSVSTHLLVAKSKVAPVKTISLPRLELCGAELLANLVISTIPQLDVESCPKFFWTDSTIVLAWLNKPPCTWSTFVANRVSKICLKIGCDNWAHVDSHDNPADLATRGLSPKDLQENSLWWHGPAWLALEKSFWPVKLARENLETSVEIKTVKVNFASSSYHEDILERFSSFAKACRVVSYLFRFFKCTHPNLRSIRTTYKSKAILSEEIKFVKTRFIVLTQSQAFPYEYNSLIKKVPIDKRSQVLNLNPFLDSDQVIRVNGRLAASCALTYNERHPILLPYHCRLAKLLVEFIHKISLHGGNQLVLRFLRQEFWIVKAKNLIKTCIHNCKVCVIHRKKYQSQIMAALPPERTTLSRPFTITGMDFAGPFEIKTYTGRACRITKGYTCIFVCFATKAIHLEPTSDLSSSAFMAAFDRFVSRRGCPSKLYSDNGTNFVGAEKMLVRNFKDFLAQSHDDVINKYGFQRLSWHFMPAGAPHMGGLWEAGVKSFKTHFRKIAGDMKFTFEEFATLLSRIEACLNSRPLSSMSENLSDLTPLTPGHFLVGGSLLSPAEPEISNLKISYLNRWQKLKALYQIFCTRWKDEYLLELQKRNKWKNSQENLKENSLVVVRSENLCPTEWRLGRVIKLYTGTDNRVRVADLQTQKGVITRPIIKLILLPDAQ